MTTVLCHRTWPLIRFSYALQPAPSLLLEYEHVCLFHNKGARLVQGIGVDPNLDPELALALRVSLEEERARQESLVANAQTPAPAAAGQDAPAGAPPDAFFFAKRRYFENCTHTSRQMWLPDLRL